MAPTWSMILTSALLLGCLINHCSALCSAEDEATFRNGHLDRDCQTKLSLLEKKKSTSVLNEKELDSLCTPSCLGKYSNWLNKTCNDTAKASFQRAACLKQMGGRENKRCRLFFPDFTNITSTKQCVVLIPEQHPACTSECRTPLQNLITRLGCCFESIYDDPGATDGLFQERFLLAAEYSALTLFQNSNVLSRCIDMKPPTCTGNPFAVGDAASGAGKFGSSRLLLLLAVGSLAFKVC